VSIVVLFGVNERAEVRRADSTAGCRPFVMFKLVLDCKLDPSECPR